MNFAYNFPFFSILFTMTAGIVSSVLDSKKAYYLNLIVTLVTTVMSAILLVTLVNEETSITYLMGHFSAPWGNEIRFGPFEAIMAFVFSIIMLFIIIGQKQVIEDQVKQYKRNLFYIMMNMMMSSLYALIYTNDLFTAYVFIEINTLCSCGLLIARENIKSIAGTMKYLLMSMLGSGLFLISIILLYDLTGHLLMVNVHDSLSVLIASGEYKLPITIIIGLLAVSMAIKSALFPFHTWVSHAYNHSLNFANAISSSLVTKGYIILLIKFIYRVFDLEVVSSLKIGNVFIVFGIISIIAGSYDALRENNSKRLLGFSSVGQIGYIFTGIGLASTVGMLAASYVIIAHAFCKTLLFLANEGLMKSSNDSKNIIDLKGVAYRNPIAALGYLVGSLALIGIPLCSGFVGKYYLSMAALESGTISIFILLALAISTVLNAIYLTRVVILMFTRCTNSCLVYKQPINASISLIVFIIINTLIGIYYLPVLEVIASGLTLL